MFAFLCPKQPSYDYGDKSPAPSAPTTPSLFDGRGLSWLWKTQTPNYDGEAAASSSPSSPSGFMGWLFGSPTPAYQTAAPPAPSSSAPPTPSSPIARQSMPLDYHGR